MSCCKDKINSLISQGQKKLLLNLEGVPYIDSAGLGEIVRTYTTVSRQGGKLKLLNLTKRIEDLLSITKLLTVFEVYETEAEALTELRLRRTGPGRPAALDGSHPLRLPRSRAPRLAHEVERAASLRAQPFSDRCGPDSGRRISSSSRRCCLASSCTRRARSRSASPRSSIFCALSGVVYLINDVMDRESDRQHPTKARSARSPAASCRSRSLSAQLP